jgi:hypothetical protein
MVKHIICIDVQCRKLLSNTEKHFSSQHDSLSSVGEFFSPEYGNVVAVWEAPHLAPVPSGYFGSWFPHR